MILDYQQIIKNIYSDILRQENKGKVPDYIPEIACISENKFGVNFTDLENNSFGSGDFQEKFSIQSISKVFALSFVYEKMGEKLWERVDVEPSGNAFNSLVQLEADNGIPRNPFINAGAWLFAMSYWKFPKIRKKNYSSLSDILQMMKRFSLMKK